MIQKMTYLLTGYGYDDTGLAYLYGDLLEKTGTQRKKITMEEARYMSLSLIKSERHCIGYYNPTQGTTLPCPDQCIMKSNQSMCASCQAASTFNPAFYHTRISNLSPYQQSYNLTPHTVYLAYFGPHSFKVGIAHRKRLKTRWLEQGARAGLVLIEASNAYEARKWEESISQKFQLPEKVMFSQKEKLLSHAYQFQKAKYLLHELGNRIMEHFFNKSLANEALDLQGYYFKIQQPNQLYPTNIAQQLWGGKIVGLLGDILIYHHSDYFFYCGLKPLLGRIMIQLFKTADPLIKLPKHNGLQTKLDLLV